MDFSDFAGRAPPHGHPLQLQNRILVGDSLLHFVLIPSFSQSFQVARQNCCVPWLFSSAAPSWDVQDGKFGRVSCCRRRPRLLEDGIPQKPVLSGSHHSANAPGEHSVFQSWCAVRHRAGLAALYSSKDLTKSFLPACQWESFHEC